MAEYFKLVWKPEAYTRATGNPAPVGVKTEKGYVVMSDGEFVETEKIGIEQKVEERLVEVVAQSDELRLSYQENEKCLKECRELLQTQADIIKSARAELGYAKKELERRNTYRSSNYESNVNNYHSCEPPRNVVDSKGRHVSSRKQAATKFNKWMFTI